MRTEQEVRDYLAQVEEELEGLEESLLDADSQEERRAFRGYIISAKNRQYTLQWMLGSQEEDAQREAERLAAGQEDELTELPF